MTETHYPLDLNRHRTSFLVRAVALLMITALPMLAALLGLMTAPARAQDSWPFVIDEGMVEYNAEQAALQSLEAYVEKRKLEEWTALLRKLVGYEWRDVDGALLELAALMGSLETLGYEREDLVEAATEAFPGYRPVADAILQERRRGERLLATYRAVLRSANAQLARYEEAYGRLRQYKLEIYAASQQGSLEIQTQGRTFGAEERLLLRHLLMDRALLRTLGVADEANRRAREDGVLQRALFGGS